MKVILYSDDVNLLSHWEKSIQEQCHVIESLDLLYEFHESIIVINYSACEGGCETVLGKLTKQKNRVLVLHRTPLFQTAQELLRLGAYGYGNAMMRDHFIVAALNAIKENMIWIYPEFTSQLILGITKVKADQEELLAPLSARESEVALLLRDGFSYKDAAEKLKITPRTIKAHAQHIYTKLQVKDRLALALLLR